MPISEKPSDSDGDKYSTGNVDELAKIGVGRSASDRFQVWREPQHRHVADSGQQCHGREEDLITMEATEAPNDRDYQEKSGEKRGVADLRPRQCDIARVTKCDEPGAGNYNQAGENREPELSEPEPVPGHIVRLVR